MNYTSPDYESNVPIVSNYTWISNSSFEFDVFQHFHQSVDSALRGILPKIDELKGLHLDPEDLLDFNEDNFDAEELLRENVGVITFLAFGIIFGLGLLLLGIIWCSARCCCSSWFQKSDPSAGYVHNRFGKSSPVSGKKKQNYSWCKLGLGIFLVCTMVVFFTFTVALFVANDQLEDSIGGLSENIDGYFQDSEQYVNLTKAQINAVMIKSYDDLGRELNRIGGCPPTTKSSVDYFEGDRRILWKFMESVRRIEELIKADSKISHSGSELTLNLKTFLTKYAKLYRVDEFCNLVFVVRDEMKTNAQEMTDALDSVPIHDTRNNLKDFEDLIETAKDYIFHSVNILNILILALFAIITAGVIVHVVLPMIKIGAISVNIGLLLIFIFGWAMWIFALVLFVSSGVMVVIVPDAYDNILNDGSLINSDTTGAKADSYVLPTAPQILQRCRNYESAYNVFELEQVFHVNELDALINRFLEAISVPFLQEFATDAIQLTNQLQNELSWDALEVELETAKSLVTRLDLYVDSKFKMVEEVEFQLLEYVDFAKKEIVNVTGGCEPLYHVLESTIHTFSYKLGSPIGVYWLALNINLFLFYPIVIASVILLRQ